MVPAMQSTDRDELRNFVAARLRVFYEEELDVPLVIFDDVLEHVLRIDNVLRHPMGGWVCEPYPLPPLLLGWMITPLS